MANIYSIYSGINITIRLAELPVRELFPDVGLEVLLVAVLALAAVRHCLSWRVKSTSYSTCSRLNGFHGYSPTSPSGDQYRNYKTTD